MDVVKQLPPEAEAARSGGPLPTVLRIVRGPYALRGWAIVSLVMNIVIVVTGGLVRLTGSGLGCPTWPRCTEDSYVSHPQLGIHGAIEFGNRLLHPGAGHCGGAHLRECHAVPGEWAAAARPALAGGWPRVRHPAAGRHRWDLRAHPAQSVRGGAALAAVDGPDRARSLAGAEDLAPHTQQRASGLSVVATRVTFVLMWLAVWLGTLVTGSGPHAGDENAPRNGLDGMLLTRLHTSMVYATVAASVICFLLLRSRAVLLLLLVEIVQGGDRCGPIPVRAADLAGRAPPTRRFAGHCGDHQLDALRVATPGDLAGQRGPVPCPGI